MSHEPSDIITPKALLLDERLTPLERNAWLAFRSLASSDGTVVLSYGALRGYLPSAPGSKRAALETVSRAVLCLRLSTWISLVEYRRNPMTGFSMASRYAVRNQPLAFDEACLEDEDYLPLLERALGHASATIRQLAQSILDEVMRHPDRLNKLPAAMRERIKCLCNRGDDHDPGGSGSSIAPETDDHIPKPVPASAAAVRTVEKEVLKEVHTYRPRSEVQMSGPDVPRRFRQLPQQTPEPVVSSSLPDAPSAAPPPSPSSQAAKPASREVAQRHLEQIRRMLKLPLQPIGQIIENLTGNGHLAQPGDLPAAGGLGGPLAQRKNRGPPLPAAVTARQTAATMRVGAASH